MSLPLPPMTVVVPALTAIRSSPLPPSSVPPETVLPVMVSL